LRRLLNRVLVQVGYDVVEAANGLEGLEIQRQEHFDLVLTDLIMPEKEGLETIQELRKRRADLKIIAMSGGGRGSGLDYLVMARQLGADRVLAKPFSNQELLKTVEGVLAS